MLTYSFNSFLKAYDKRKIMGMVVKDAEAITAMITAARKITVSFRGARIREE